MALKNHPFCPWSPQDTFMIYSSRLHHHIFQTYFPKRNKFKTKFGNHQIKKLNFTNKCLEQRTPRPTPLDQWNINH